MSDFWLSSKKKRPGLVSPTSPTSQLGRTDQTRLVGRPSSVWLVPSKWLIWRASLVGLVELGAVLVGLEQVVGSGGQVWAVGRLLVGLVGPVNLAGIFSCFVLHSWYDRAGGSASSVFPPLIIAVKLLKRYKYIYAQHRINAVGSFIHIKKCACIHECYALIHTHENLEIYDNDTHNIYLPCPFTSQCRPVRFVEDLARQNIFGWCGDWPLCLVSSYANLVADMRDKT